MIIDAKIKKMIFVAQDSQFGVCKAEIQKIEENDKNLMKYDSIIIKGNVGHLREDLLVHFEGEFVQDKKYGIQFNAVKSNIQSSESEVIYLAMKNHLLKGVGEMTVIKMKKKFGENIKDIIENNPEELLQIPRFTKEKLDIFLNSYQEYLNDKRFIDFCTSNGLSLGLKSQLEVLFGNIDDALNEIVKNPYLLTSKVKGVGFKTADKIAQNIGIAEDDPRRILAAFVFLVTEQAIEKGHCYLPLNQLIKDTIALIGTNYEEKIVALADTLKRNTEPKLFAEIIDDNYVVWNKKLYNYELEVTKNLGRIIDGNDIDAMNYEEEIRRWEDSHFNLDELQKEAVLRSLSNKVSIITGGPGTGKTTITRTILDILEENGLRKHKIAFLAPTGKAAKRMSEVLNAKAMTIHRALGVFNVNDSEEDYTMAKKERFSQYECFIVDETSMIDLPIFKSFIEAVPENAKLIFLGDIHQLPSVGAGNVLKDLIESETIPTSKLEKIYRQSADTLIVSNAAEIKNGNSNKFNFASDRVYNDFSFMDLPSIKNKNEDEKKEVYEYIQKAVIHEIKRIMTLDKPDGGKYTLDDIMLLIPIRKSSIGVETFNTLLQEEFNKDGLVIPVLNNKFRVGDRVMQTKNNYDLDIFNGDQGIILDYTVEGKRVLNYDEKNQDDIIIHVDFKDKVVEIRKDDIKDLTLAYAMTIHKSQGSEYPAIVMPITFSYYTLLQRNLIYTGLTRSRNYCSMLGEKQAVKTAINNDMIERRYTNLAERLKNYLEKHEDTVLNEEKNHAKEFDMAF